VKRAGDEMDTQDLIEVLAREVLKEIAKRENQSLSENIKHSPEKSIITAFLGNDEVLKDELKKETSVVDNIKLDSTWEEIEKNENKNKKRLVVSTLGINDLIDLSQGKKSIITEFLFNEGEVLLVEEGLEYKKYTKPAALISLYDEYVKKVQEFGIKVVKRTEVKNSFDAKEKLYLKGLVTESRLRKLGLKNQILEVDAKSKVTSLAMDYIKENSIELCYERGQ
jgi:ethanolamine utilization protein